MIRAGVLTKREMLCLRYRWEFLRRNKEYQSDYDYITTKLKVTDLFKKEPTDPVAQKVIEVLLKWDLLAPIPPYLSFSALLKSDEKLKSVYIESLAVGEFAIDCSESPDLLSPEDLYVKGSMVEMSVDMKFPKEKILDEFNLLVDIWQKQLKRMLKKIPKAKKPAKRLQIAQYERYLKIYDRHRKGMTFEKLAKQFYPAYIELPGKDYAKRKVLRDINNCLRLIHGGYKQIR
jgi:hypothetical protein